VVFDVLVRYLRSIGMDVTFARNFTDVDDKIINRANQEGISSTEVAEKYIRTFHEDMDRLNVLRADIEPKCTQHIGEMIALCEDLIAKGKAYSTPSGDVYFRVRAFPEYGKLSGRDVDEMRSGARIAPGEEKEDPLDFALWKSAKPGEPHWVSPWGNGRPGWHIECSAMSEKHMPLPLDIHGGGLDLIFPHHENEIAQSTCACGGDFAAHWFHITHLLVDGGKMSKSLGNLYTITDLEERGFTAMELRYVLIGAHYRKPLNFTLESLSAAREAMAKLAKGARALAAKTEGETLLDSADFGPFQPAWDSLNHDLNTPGALGGLFTGLRAASSLDGKEAAAALAGLNRMLRALGLTLPEEPAHESPGIPADIRELAETRWQARLAKNWAESDTLRAALAGRGWLVKDGKESYTLEPLP
jgi:cysteinyl-tRNA synthetase